MVVCNSTTNVNDLVNDWIIDSGATDHMTATLSLRTNVKKVSSYPDIKLPTGATTEISHVGDMCLDNGLKLSGVLYVPQFSHNLLSIHKLAQDNDCQVMFYPNRCLIIHSATKAIRGNGLLKNGLYYLVCSSHKECNNVVTKKSDYALWHYRLGHAPMAKILSIPEVKQLIQRVSSHVCVTCPMVRFVKLPFELSTSHSDTAFELVHADIWGTYRVHTRGSIGIF